MAGAVLVGLVRYGGAAITGLTFAGMGRVLLVSMAVGAGLSLLGVVYPAVVAARMRPVEAMRAQE